MRAESGRATAHIHGIGRPWRTSLMYRNEHANLLRALHDYRRNVASTCIPAYALLARCRYVGDSHLKMHITLQFALQSATLISMVVGFLGLINTINNYRRQMNAEIFIKYTERYERILDQFPQDALAARFDAKLLPPQSPQLRLCVLKYLNLCSEEYYLMKNGYLAKPLWRIWEGDLKRIIGSPLLQREWSSLRQEFLSHQAFLEYVEQVQTQYKKANAAHA
jgi:hypothetical protein